MPSNFSLICTTVSKRVCSTFSLDKPMTSTCGMPEISCRTTWTSGTASPVHHSRLTSKSPYLGRVPRDQQLRHRNHDESTIMADDAEASRNSRSSGQ